MRISSQPPNPLKKKETIFASATAQGRAGVAVIRISGPKALEILMLLTGISAQPKLRELFYTPLFDPHTKEEIDHAMAVYFKAPHSFTGEDCVELHLHGSPTITERIYQILSSQPLVRLAEAGEFTRRAFEHGKLDLTEAEAIADLIDAETEAQRRQALKQLSGALGKLYKNWHERLKKALAHQEALIDFSEEEKLEGMDATLTKIISSLQQEVEAHLQEGHKGEKIREGIDVSIVGAPNAGKSTFLNQLAKKEIAIVTDIPGTTRDIIEIKLDIGGYPVIFADTAGLRETKDKIEAIGVQKALKRAASADIKLILLDGTLPFSLPDGIKEADKSTIFLINKADKQLITRKNNLEKLYPNAAIFEIAAQSGMGLNSFLTYLENFLKQYFAFSEAPNLTRQRHRIALEKLIHLLDEALNSDFEDLRAEALRASMHQLGTITGHVNVEDLLDIIFQDFCIGK